MGRKLSAAELARYRQMLEALRRVIAGDIHDLQADAFPENDDRPSVDNPADAGSDRHAQEFSLELLRRDEENMEEIAEALERIADGSYGLCEACSAAIPKARLNAIPFTRNCVDCQRALERAD